jgi:hypothetical protein
MSFSSNIDFLLKNSGQ